MQTSGARHGTESGRVRCPGCGTTLGEFVAGMFVLRHRGREAVTHGVVSVRCDACGQIWRPTGTTEGAPAAPATGGAPVAAG